MDRLDGDAIEFSHRTVYSKFDKDDVKKVEKNIKAEHVKAYVWCEAEMRSRLQRGDWDRIRQGALVFVKHKSKQYYVYLLDTYYNAKDTKVCVKIDAGYNALLSEKFVCIFDANGEQQVHAIFCSVDSAKKWYDVFQGKQHKRQNVMPVQNKLNNILFPHQKHHVNPAANEMLEPPHFSRIEPTRATAPKSNNAVKRAKSKSENPIVAEDASFDSWNTPRDNVVEKFPGVVLRQVPPSPPYPDSPNAFYVPNFQSTQSIFTAPVYADEAPPVIPRRTESIPQPPPPQRKPPPTSPPPPMPPIPDYRRRNGSYLESATSDYMVGLAKPMNAPEAAPPPPPVPRHHGKRSEKMPKREEVIQAPLSRPLVEVVPPPERKSSINLPSEKPPPPPSKVVPVVVPPSHVVVNNNMSTNSSAKNKAAPPPPKIIEPAVTLDNNVEAKTKVALKPLPPTPDEKTSNSKHHAKAPKTNDAEYAELNVVVKTPKASKTPMVPKNTGPPPPPMPTDLFGNKKSETTAKSADNDGRAALMDSIRAHGGVEASKLPKVSKASKSPVKKAALPPTPPSASGAQAPPPPSPPPPPPAGGSAAPPPPPPPPAALLGSSSSGTLPPVSDTRANLMDSIRNFGGIQGIKKVNKGKPKSPTSKSPKTESKMDLNSELKKSMASMRKYIESDEEQEEENWD